MVLTVSCEHLRAEIKHFFFFFSEICMDWWKLCHVYVFISFYQCYLQVFLLTLFADCPLLLTPLRG